MKRLGVVSDEAMRVRTHAQRVSKYVTLVDELLQLKDSERLAYAFSSRGQMYEFRKTLRMTAARMGWFVSTARMADEAFGLYFWIERAEHLPESAKAWLAKHAKK